MRLVETAKDVDTLHRVAGGFHPQRASPIRSAADGMGGHAAGEEARELLLSIAPLLGLGQMREQLYERLRQNTATSQPELEAMSQAAAQETLEELDRLRKPIAQTVPEQYMLLVMCDDEKQQLELLARFQSEGLECKVLLSSRGSSKLKVGSSAFWAASRSSASVDSSGATEAQGEASGISGSVSKRKTVPQSQKSFSCSATINGRSHLLSSYAVTSTVKYSEYP